MASRPTDADRARVFTMLQSRLGTSAKLVGSTLPHHRARSLAAKTVGITAIALTVVGGGVATLYSFERNTPPSVENLSNISTVGKEQPLVPPTLTTAPTPELPSQPEGPSTPVAGPSQTVPPPAGSVRGTVRSRDSLSEEVAILSRAQTELHGGRAASALRVLAEHERKFKHGILAQERTAAKIQALCALERVNEANALLSGLSPQSLSGDSARQACSSAKKVTPNR
jgi:hypothetical protein